MITEGDAAPDSEDESLHPDPCAEPGTWDHFLTVVRPWLTFLSRYEPDAPADA